MKKSELKRHIKEALTPDEASKVDSKYKEIYSGMLKNNPLKLKKYDNPDAVAYGRAIKLIQKESANVEEKQLTAAEKNKKEDIIMSMKDKKGGKDKLQPADYAAATSQAKKLAEITGDTRKMEDLLKQILRAIRGVDKSQDDTEEDVEALDTSIDYLSAAITDKDPIDIALDQSQLGRLAKPIKETGMAKAKKNMDMYKDKNRLTELIKSALMNETSTDKYDDNPALKGKQSDLPDGLQKAIIKKSGGKVNETRDSKIDDLVYKLHYAVGGADQLLKELIIAMSTDDAMLYLSAIAQDYGIDIETGERESGTIPAFENENVDESFDSLVKKVDKAKGYTKKEAEKVAGAIAAKKMKGAGKGPTAKQKKRMAETILKELRGNINEAEVSPEKAADKAIKTLATKLEKSPEMDKLAAKVAKNPKLMAQLEKAVKAAGVNVELAEDESGLDMGDLKTMALNLAKKEASKKMEEGISNDPDQDDVSAGLAMAAFVGGGSLGAAFGSTILAAIPSVADIFAGPALVGAAAGVGLFLLARKAYLMANPDL